MTIILNEIGASLGRYEDQAIKAYKQFRGEGNIPS